MGRGMLVESPFLGLSKEVALSALGWGQGGHVRHRQEGVCEEL